MDEILCETTFELRSRDVDFAGFWKPSAVQFAMQEAAEIHATQLGAGWEALQAKKLAWVLTKSCVEMDSYPRLGQTVLLRTWPAKPRHQMFPRYFEFETAAGEPFGRASTVWVVMDTGTRRLAADSDVQIAVNDTRTAPLGLPRTPRVLDAPAEISAHRAAYDDLDINRHVNNTRYVDWLCDALPLELFENSFLHTLTVAYESEILPGETVSISLARQADGFSLTGESAGRLCFSAAGSFAAR